MHESDNCEPFLTQFSFINRLKGLRQRISGPDCYERLRRGLATGLYTKRFIEGVAQGLVVLGQRAHSVRRMDVVEEAGSMLTNLPVPPQFRRVGEFYHALSLWRGGRLSETDRLFGTIADELPDWFRGRAFISIASFHLIR